MALVAAAGAALLTGGTSALLGFAVNTAASVGMNLVASWLSPKKTNRTVEDTPSMGAGSRLHCCFGLTFCPTTLLYALPANKAGHGDDKSSYGLLGCINPDSTGEIEAFRINNYITGSKNPLFPLKIPATVTDQGTYLGQNSIKTYNDFSGFKYQFFLNQPNTAFGLLGYPSLQYTGINWFAAEGVKRDIFGGNNSRVTLYLKNRITNTAAQLYNVTFNHSISITTKLGITGKFIGIGGSSVDIPFTYPNGFFGARVFKHFEIGVAGQYDLIGISGGSEYVIYNNPPSYSDINFIDNTAIVPGGSALPFGLFAGNVSPVITSVITNKLVIGKLNGKLEEVLLPTAEQSPFTSQNGVIRDASNNVVGNIPVGYRLYGWDGTIFVNGTNDPLYPALAKWVGINPPSGTVQVSSTRLVKIIEDLYKSKYPDKVCTNNESLELVRGFTSTFDDVGQTIVNLATAFGKFVYEQPDGNLTIKEYPKMPIDTTTIRSYQLRDFLEEPTISFTPVEQQPNTMEFLYRDYTKEFSEKSVRVGYGDIQSDAASMRLDIVATVEEARKMAWTTLFLQSGTNVALKFRVATVDNVEKGRLIRVEIKDPSRQEVPHFWVVADVEIGRDSTYIVTCVNWVPLADLLEEVNVNSFSSYMLGKGQDVDTSSTGGSVNQTVTSRIILAEPTDYLPFTTSPDWKGALLFTDRNQNYTSGTGPSGTPTLYSKTGTSSGRFAGYVESIDWRYGNPKYGIERLVLRRAPGTNGTINLVNSLVRVGTSWIRGNCTNVGDTYIFGKDTVFGLYASESIIYSGDYCYNLDQSQYAPGMKKVGVQTLALPTVNASQEGLINTFYDYQSSPPVNYTDVTSRYPYGTPVPGWMMAAASISYNFSSFKIYTSSPGNYSTDAALLWDNETLEPMPQASYYISINGNPFTFLTTLAYPVPDVLSIPFFLPPGASWVIAAGTPTGGNHYAGSYVFSGTNLV